jgi:pimeloyl-ACP methyl ester carboxylesterase
VSEPLPIVLIPGLLASARLYAEQIPHLWRAGSVTIADHTRDDSMSAIAQRILSMAPERIARLALLDTSARADVPEQTLMRRAHMQLASQGRLTEVLEQQWPRLVHPAHRGDAALREVLGVMADEVGPAAFIRQQNANLGRRDSRPTLGSIRCPTLVLVGEGDELTPPERAAEIAAGIAGARLVTVPRSGHLSTLEQPEAVTRALLQWLEG